MPCAMRATKRRVSVIPSNAKMPNAVANCSARNAVYKPKKILVKGLRAVTDFDYELQMAQMNNRMAGMETFFVAASPQWSYLSSSLIKEVVRFGGDVTGLVPAVVQERLAEKLVPGTE